MPADLCHGHSPKHRTTMTTQLSIPTQALSAIQTVPFTALTFSTTTTLQAIGQYSHVPGELYDEAARLGLTPAGPIQYVYTGVNSDETNEFTLEIALPVATSENPTSRFATKTFDAFSCVQYTYAGPWDAMMAMYDALFATFYQAGYQADPDKRVREVYTVVDFENPENCVTEIQIGLE